MKVDFTSDDPLSHFLAGHTDEHEERGSLLLLNASIVLLVASLVTMAIILSWGNPLKVFADTASLTNTSAPQPGTDQSTPTIPSAPTVQSAADAQALPTTTSDAPIRNEIAAASEPANQSQTEMSEPTSEALFKQFQAWAAERPQVEPAQPIQDAPAPVAENAEASVQPMQKRRRVRHLQDARAEIRPVQSSDHRSGGSKMHSTGPARNRRPSTGP
jgi:cytoskeletal protein RodZ